MVNLVELCHEFEKMNLAFIQGCHEDSGIMRAFIENCQDDYQRQIAEHFIRVNEIEIENAMEEIQRDRETAAELEKL